MRRVVRAPKDRTAGVLSTALPAGATRGSSPDLRPGIAGAPAEDPETARGYEDPEASRGYEDPEAARGYISKSPLQTPQNRWRVCFSFLSRPA